MFGLLIPKWAIHTQSIKMSLNDIQALRKVSIVSISSEWHFNYYPQIPRHISYYHFLIKIILCKNKGIWVYNTDTNTCLLTCVEEIGFLSLEICMHIIRFYDGY